MRPVDPRIQRFFWEQYLPAHRGHTEARRLVDALDEAAGVAGCWPDEMWVLRGCYVASQTRRGASEGALMDALPDLEIGEVAFYLAEAGLIRLVGSERCGVLWAATEEGRALLGRHQNEAEPSAAGARFLRGQARTGALAPWRPRVMATPAKDRCRRRQGRRQR